MSEANTIYKRALALIGKEALDTLSLHGLGVVEDAAVAKFLAEHKASNARLREAAAACMRAAGLVVVRAEMLLDVEGNPSIIITHPLGDEDKLAREIAEILSGLFHPEPGGRAPTDEERDRMTRDTNDVDIQAKPGDSEES